MTVLQIWLSQDARFSERELFALVETEFADFAAAAAHVDAGGALAGARLLTRRKGPETVVKSRTPVMLAAAAILRMELPPFPVVEAAAA